MPELLPGEGEIPDVADDTTLQHEDRPAYRLEKFAPWVIVRYQDELLDPRLHFLGAPLTTSSGDVAEHLRKYHPIPGLPVKAKVRAQDACGWQLQFKPCGYEHTDTQPVAEQTG